MVDQLIAMRIELRGQAPESGGLALAVVARQQADSLRVQEPLEAFGELRQRAVIPKIGGDVYKRQSLT